MTEFRGRHDWSPVRDDEVCVSACLCYAFYVLCGNLGELKRRVAFYQAKFGCSRVKSFMGCRSSRSLSSKHILGSG